jgi:hypothetical protein
MFLFACAHHWWLVNMSCFFGDIFGLVFIDDYEIYDWIMLPKFLEIRIIWQHIFAWLKASQKVGVDLFSQLILQNFVQSFLTIFLHIYFRRFIKEFYLPVSFLLCFLSNWLRCFVLIYRSSNCWFCCW